MMEGRTYLASDLAVELELPRSTINDWLVRYADYLEVETRGKRKVYSNRALGILKEISGFRNDGKSSFEIEQLLAARYGIRPEVTAPPPAVPAAGAPDAEQPESGPPAARPAFERMTLQINTEFLKLADRLEEAERGRRRLAQRMWAITAAVIVGLGVVFLVLAFVMYQMFGRVEKKNREAAEALNRQSGEQLGKMTVALDGSRRDFEKNIARLKAELAAQRSAFEAKLQQMEANSATRAEAQLLQFKEEFARRQREELQRIELLRNTLHETSLVQLKAVREEARRRQEAAANAAQKQKEFETTLTRKLHEEVARVKPPAPAPVPAVPKAKAPKPQPAAPPAAPPKPAVKLLPLFGDSGVKPFPGTPAEFVMKPVPKTPVGPVAKPVFPVPAEAK